MATDEQLDPAMKAKVERAEGMCEEWLKFQDQEGSPRQRMIAAYARAGTPGGDLLREVFVSGYLAGMTDPNRGGVDP